MTVPGEATGSVSRVGERHQYTLELTEGQIVYLRGDKAKCGDGEVWYTLINPKGSGTGERTACDDIGRFVVDATGMYTVRVRGARDTGTGPYSIRISRQ